MAIAAGDQIKYFLVMAHPGEAICADCLASKLQLSKLDDTFAEVAGQPGFVSRRDGCIFCAQIKEVLLHQPSKKPRQRAAAASLFITSRFPVHEAISGSQGRFSASRRTENH